MARPKRSLEERTMLTEWAAKKGDGGMAEYRAKKNSKSIDGLPTGFPSEIQ